MTEGGSTSVRGSSATSIVNKGRLHVLLITEQTRNSYISIFIMADIEKADVDFHEEEEEEDPVSA